MSLQRGKSDRMTSAQLDRLMEEDAFRVIDDIRSEADLPRARNGDAEMTREYSNEQRDSRMDSMERMMAQLAVRIDLALDRRASTPVEPSWRPSDRETYVRAHMERERLEIPPQEGKGLAGDIFVQKLIPKPHMFIDKLEGKTLRQKQDYREAMTLPEYLNGYVSMLCDPRARSELEFMDQIAHLRDVTEDAITCTWPSVRRWSCLIFDLVEKGRISWADSQLIQNYRMRNTVRGHTAGAHQLVDSPDAQHTKEVPCPEFNLGTCTVGGLRKHHNIGAIRLAHLCSYCLALDGTRADTHGTVSCRKKQRHAAIIAGSAANQHGQQYPQHYQHPNATFGGRGRPYSQFQPQPAQPAPAPSMAPKNA